MTAINEDIPPNAYDDSLNRLFDKPDPVIAGITERLEALQLAEDNLKDRLATVRVERERYGKALALLTGEPKSKPQPKRERPLKDVAMKISPEKAMAVMADILRFDRDEFRQVDIRTMPGASSLKSSQMSLAFEYLRQHNRIRMARVDGNNKWYRLTREELILTTGDGDS